MSKPGEIIIQFDAGKLDAVRQFSGETDPPIEEELTAMAEKIYAKRVPVPVRQFIEKRPIAAAKTRKTNEGA